MAQNSNSKMTVLTRFFLWMVISIQTITAAFTANYAAFMYSVRSQLSLQSTVSSKNAEQRKITQMYSSPRSPIQEKIRYIAGRRALILHPNSSSQRATKNLPLVILGGMAQSISSWEFHLQQLCATRSVMVYEALGQGPPPPSEVCAIDGKEVTLDQYYKDVTLERQGRDFWEVVDEAFFHPDSYFFQNYGHASERQVDVAGFSFGGRVAMSAATLQPKRIRRLHLTGVGAERDEFANVILASWKDILGAHILSRDDSSNDEVQFEECNPELQSSGCTSRLRAFAWSIILATYSEEFLSSAGSKRVSSWVDGVCQYNTEEGLKAILMQTHGSFVNDFDSKQTKHSTINQQIDFWTTTAMAQRIISNDCIESYKVLVGSNDKMSSPFQARMLTHFLRENDSADVQPRFASSEHFRVIEGCGHAVPMEAQRIWREDLIKFLS